MLFRPYELLTTFSSLFAFNYKYISHTDEQFFHFPFHIVYSHYFVKALKSPVRNDRATSMNHVILSDIVSQPFLKVALQDATV